MGTGGEWPDSAVQPDPGSVEPREGRRDDP